MGLLQRGEGGDTRYDAFISYSHAADADVARALRDGLQRFATPWSPWRAANPVRSLRVFRDQSALSADPALWPAIERALAASEWFVLLASVAAAASPWIDREVAWWRAHKPAGRLLLVQTDGELAWDDDAGDFDWQASSVLPPSLAGAFAAEPLWLDLRWTATHARADARDPRFQDAIASIAAPIRGIPKDELIGEDIRQHRRLRRWRNLAAACLLALLLGALVAADLARRQRNLALEREAEAVSERARAERQAEAALSRQLAAQSVQMRLQSVARIELSLLLGVESVRRDPSPEGVLALARALALTPARVSRFRHRWGQFQPYAMVLHIAFSPDGRLLASANEDGSIALWRVGGARVWHRGISQERVRKIAFGPDGRLLATAAKDGVIGLWRVQDGEAVARFRHDAPATGVAFDPAGRYLASAGDDGTARLWALDDGTELGRIDFGGGATEVQDLAVSPDGSLVAAINEGGRVCLWDTAARRDAGCLLSRATGLRVAFAPDGTRVATASENFAIVWDVASGEPLHRFEHSDLLDDADMAHFLWVDAVAFSPDGRFLATASRDRTARLWDLESGQEARRLEETAAVETLVFSPDGRRIATATAVGTVRVWSVPGGRELFRIGQLADSFVGALAFSPDGERLAAGSWSSEIGVWSLRSAGEAARLHHPEDVELMTFSPDGRLLATAADDDVVRVWDTHGWTVVAEARRYGPRRLLFADDGRHLLLQSRAGGLEVLAVGDELAGVSLEKRPPGDVVLTRRLVLLERRGLFDAWRAAGGEVVARGLGRELAVDAFDVSDARGLLAVAYAGQEAVELWDVLQGRRLATLPVGARVLRLALDHRGERVAVVHARPRPGAGRYDPPEYLLQVWRVADGERGAEVTLGGLEPVFLHFLPDGRRLVMGTGDWRFPGEVHVLDPSRDEGLVTLDDVGEVRTLRLAPDGEHLAISDGGRVRVWSLGTGRVVAPLPADGSVNTIGFTADGRHLAVATGDDDVTLWPWRADDLVERACSHLTRNLTPGEWQDFLPARAYRATCTGLVADDGRADEDASAE